VSDDKEKAAERLKSAGFEELKRFSVDEAGDIYYNGKRIQVGNVLSLEKWQFATGAVFGLISVIFGLFGVAYNVVYVANTAFHWNGFGPPLRLP